MKTLKTVAAMDVATLALGDLIDQLIEMKGAAFYWQDKDRNFAKAANCRARVEELRIELNRRMPCPCR